MRYNIQITATSINGQNKIFSYFHQTCGQSHTRSWWGREDMYIYYVETVEKGAVIQRMVSINYWNHCGVEAYKMWHLSKYLRRSSPLTSPSAILSDLIQYWGLILQALFGVEMENKFKKNLNWKCWVNKNCKCSFNSKIEPIQDRAFNTINV